jgi:uncharacterized protein YbaP (TraB family)
MRIPFLRRVVAVSSLAIALVLFGVARASALPALWVVETPTSKVYLFGTVHALKPGMTWHSAVMDAALAESQDLWLEIANPNDTAGLLSSMRDLCLDPAHPLSTQISTADVALLDQRVKSLGLSGESSLESMRPWCLSAMLVVLPMMHGGYSAASGADLNVRSAFTNAHKPVHGFETMDQQLHFLADMPEAEQVAQLHRLLASTGSSSSSTPTAAVDDLVALWYNGDVDRIASVADAYARLDPTVSSTLLVQRNANFAKQIADMLQQPGVSFVAVGALHFAGAQSVLADLEKLGYQAHRIQ